MFHTLTVKKIDNPIPEATTITFDVPQNLYEEFNYKPGQHLVIKLVVNGEEARRSYSLNSCPYNDEELAVTVKRVKDGLVSNYVGDHLKVGDQVQSTAPQGRFYADVTEDTYKTYFLFAAGSGITPIFSILKSVLVASPSSVVNLFYGNKDQDSIIFKDELQRLEAQYADRLNVVHTLSGPKIWTTWEQWSGRKGRIDPKDVEWFITKHPPVAQSTEYYICGPGAMNTSIRDTLVGLGVPADLVHIEQFGGKVKESESTIEAVDNAVVDVMLKRNNHKLNIPSGTTILQALKDANADPPYSCESGVCGSCVAQIKSGTAEMKSCMALDDDEITKGNVLTCQALPTSAQVEIIFE